jgi:hypothetical protein
MAGFEAGGGAGVGALGPLQAMWRGVYRKAAEAAEAVVATLLERHVYHLHGRRAVTVVLDGGGAALATGEKCDLELPWAYVLEAWALYADQAGDLVVDLQRGAGLATYPGDLASLCAGDGALKPTLSAAAAARSEDLTGWTPALPRGCVLRVAVQSAATVRLVTLTLHLRAI